MAILNINYHVEEGQHGYKVIRTTGRCTASEKPVIKQYVITRWQWATVPQSVGAVFKSLDGQNPVILLVVVPTTGENYRCVKIGALIQPFAPMQAVGPYAGQYILRFEITYQEVGYLAV